MTRSIDSNVLEKCFKTLLWVMSVWHCFAGLNQSGSGSILISHKCSSLVFTLHRACADREKVLGSCLLNTIDKETLTVTCLCSFTPLCWKAGEIYDAQSANWWLFWRIGYVTWKCQAQHSAELKNCFSGEQIWSSLQQWQGNWLGYKLIQWTSHLQLRCPICLITLS